jgi:predicted nucleotidyltransferase
MSGLPGLDVDSGDLQLLLSILQRHVPDRTVRAFGSRVKGQAKPFSDLDLAVMGDEPLSLDTLAALNEALAESDLPWKVDVLDWARTSESFRQIIAARHVVVQQGSPTVDTQGI